MNRGESAEHAVTREVLEETGLKVLECRFNRSEYFEKSNTLMLNFSCIVEEEDLSGVTKEVDLATWFTRQEAREQIKPGSLACKFLNCYLDHEKM